MDRKKYIVEASDDVKKVIALGVTHGGAIWTDTTDIENLEELNSDYINEHYGDLQDTAYQKGINDGSLDVKQRVEGAYQRGLDDAWEAARKVGHCKLWDDYTKDTGKPSVCAVAVLDHYTAYEAIEKLKAYEEKQDDKPIIGEVVERYLNGKRDGVGMFLGEDGDYWNCLFWTGAIFGTFAYPSNQFKRTGNVCDIEKILEAMKHD